MGFKFFGFKGNLHRRKKVPKEKGDVVCTGYKVNPELYSSLPPPAPQGNSIPVNRRPESKVVLGSAKEANGDVPHRVLNNRPGSSKNPEVQSSINDGIPNGVLQNWPESSSIILQPKNIPNIKGKEVIRGRKSTAKPTARDLFNTKPENDTSEDPINTTPAVLNKTEQPSGVQDIDFAQLDLGTQDGRTANTTKEGTTGAETDPDRNSNVFFFTENHDDDVRQSRQARDDDDYEDVVFPQRRTSTDSDFKINVVQYSKNFDAQSDESDNETDDHAENAANKQQYSSQAESLFFGGHEPDSDPRGPKKLVYKENKMDEGRSSETSA